MRWLALHFPHLALDLFSAEQVEVNNTTQTARVILQDHRICQANTAALQQGIQIGCTLATAHSICSTLLYKQRNLEAEQNV